MTNILILGAGAIGAFYGSRLAQSEDVQVSCICRSSYQVVRSRGFSIQSPTFGSTIWKPKNVFRDAEDARKSNVRWQYIIVTTKVLPDVNDDSKILEHLVNEDTTIVLIQNGIGIEQPYHDRFPNLGILSAVTITSAAQPEPGRIKHNKWTKLDIGAFPRDTAHLTEQNRQLCHLLARGGIKDASPCSSQHLQLLRWHKVAINAAMNPSSVLSGGSPVNEMANNVDMYKHLKSVMEEVFEVSRKVNGRAFPETFANADQVLESSKGNSGVPSMLMDWNGKRPMELEVILGNVIKQAQIVGVTTPRLSAMYALLKTAQMRRSLSKANL